MIADQKWSKAKWIGDIVILEVWQTSDSAFEETFAETFGHAEVRVAKPVFVINRNVHNAEVTIDAFDLLHSFIWHSLSISRTIDSTPPIFNSDLVYLFSCQPWIQP